MARVNKLYEKPLATTIAATDRMTFGQLQLDGEYKVKTITRANEMCQTVTYAALTALSGSYVVGQQYLITNATSANFNLIVKAVAVDEIGYEAQDPLYPNDVVYYNFGSNVITWRWDTINDISAGEDWRNSNNISIGVNCKYISIGGGCISIIIGQGAFNVNIELSGNITTKADTYNLKIIGCSDINLSNNSQVEWDGSFAKKIISSFDGGNIIQYYNANILTSTLIV